jgi:ElaB/YqjD/DUF883 family membrane-anchored ribosome-binding protein
MHRLNLFAIVATFTLIVAGILPCTAIAALESPSSIEQTFQKAKQDYLEKNMNSAAQQIQKSASFMKAKASKASDKGKEALNTSAKELEKLADDVKKGTVTSVKRIEETFARAYVALASDSHIKSTESWAKKEKEKAGDALDSANKYLERSFAWAGQKIETKTKEAMKKSKELSLKLKKKGSEVAEDVGKGLQDTGNEIEKFGKRISSK